MMPLRKQKAIVEERNNPLQEIRYDHALNVIGAQPELFEMDGEVLQKRIRTTCVCLGATSRVTEGPFHVLH